MEQILSRAYYFDDLSDLERDISEAISEASIPTDDSGVFNGEIKVEIVYIPAPYGFNDSENREDEDWFFSPNDGD